MNNDLSGYLHHLREAIDVALRQAIAHRAAPEVIAGPVLYALLGPGKRIRPCLTLATAEAVAVRGGIDVAHARRLALPAACAVEMIHCYSLVHDDLPAMDNDALRRGRPTTHIVYGDGMAILAGDGLLTDAFALVASPPAVWLGDDAPPPQRLDVVTLLAVAAGTCGMVGGQAIDLAAVGAAVQQDKAALTDMHLRKTGALIRAACVSGAILTGADQATADGVDTYARELGLAFQIVDDVLDVEGSREALGKTAGKDAAAGKPTFPALYGLAESKRMAEDCVDRAKAALASVGLGGRLAAIAEWSLERKA